MGQIKCPAVNCNRGVVANVYDHEGICTVCNGTGFVEGLAKPADFNPAFDMPATKEQALQCLEKWGDPLCVTFDCKRAKRMLELLSEPAQPARNLMTLTVKLDSSELLEHLKKLNETQVTVVQQLMAACSLLVHHHDTADGVSMDTYFKAVNTASAALAAARQVGLYA